MFALIAPALVLSTACNCSVQRSGWNAGSGSISGKLNVTSTAECCSLCMQQQGCVVWTFAVAEKSCWLKDNNRGSQKEADRITGQCSEPPSPPSTVEVTVEPNATLVATTGATFVSYTMDWWAPDQGCKPEGWGPHANVLEVDLRSPKLRALARALGPATLRIGGSLDKKVRYEMPGTPSCPGSALCLNASRWDELHAFAAAVDAQLVFGLSYPQLGESGTWNSTEAESLFTYSKARGYSRATTLLGFELGEEARRPRIERRTFTMPAPALN